MVHLKAIADCGFIMCETPKSPPGDYNPVKISPCCTASIGISVKHLNPRQGITTRFRWKANGGFGNRVKHLNPRQGITTCRRRPETGRMCSSSCETPKSPPGDYKYFRSAGTTRANLSSCETPKSPPGDYNSGSTVPSCHPSSPSLCETPKSPPGDYNSSLSGRSATAASSSGVKHLNPRQGITTRAAMVR